MQWSKDQLFAANVLGDNTFRRPSGIFLSLVRDLRDEELPCIHQPREDVIVLFRHPPDALARGGLNADRQLVVTVRRMATR